MEEQQNPLTYDIIKAAVAGEKWATEKVVVLFAKETFDSKLDAVFWSFEAECCT